MEILNTLTEDNLLLFAAKCYYNPRCTDIQEFYEDLNKIRYIKRILSRYDETDKLSERLLLNHIITFFNVFGIEGALKILEFKIPERHWSVIKPILIFLKYIRTDQYAHIPMDPNVVAALRKI